MSPYFPPEAHSPPYWCPNCEAWFHPGAESCTVIHFPGECCHEYERRVEPQPPPPLRETP